VRFLKVITFNVANDFISEESAWILQNSGDLLNQNSMFFFVAFSRNAGSFEEANKQFMVNKSSSTIDIAVI
jgi:hypothetical protein